jgi:peroxiredoxin
MKTIHAALLAFTIALSASASADVAVNKPAPDFTLSDTNGKTVKLSQFKDKHVVLEWLNHDCPFVKKHYGSSNMQSLQKKYTSKGVIWLSVISSAKGKQGSSTSEAINKLTSEKKANPTAVLLDSDGTVGKLYGAKTTPHMFVINPKGLLVYAGAIDDKPSTDVEDVVAAKNYVSAALDESMAAKPITTASTQSYGCSVKY